MSKIIANGIRIEGQAPSSRGGYGTHMNSADLVSGYDCSIQFHPLWHHVVLVKEKGADNSSVFLCALPDEEWESDLISRGFEIICNIKDVI